MSAHAGEVARGDLAILGLGLEVDRNPVVTAVDIPAVVQTIFAGQSNDEAPPAPGLSALGDLTGPGIDTPITLATKPGHAFQLPALHEKGEYTLQNIRLVGEGGEFLQPAVPSFAVIQVADVLQTSVRVRQLTAAELRERGINVDSRNYEVYEYTFVFSVDQSTVEVPYSVIVDKRTHVIQPLIADPYQLPPLKFEKPPRFTPPQTQVFDLGQAGPLPPSSNALDKTPPAPPSIPAALVVPNGFGVLHQFFAVILHVDNAAPEGSEIRLDSVTATIGAPLQMRVAKVLPAVSIGQPVPIFDEVTGATFLVAGAKGTAEWTLEALEAGTHTVNIEVNATYHKPGQEDFPLRGRVSTSLVVSDPRFHINFSHPETVRKDEPYTAYAFITNLSPQRQHVRLDTNDIPQCSSGGAFENICRTTGEGMDELDIEAGEMVSVPYALASKINGKVFAAGGSANDEALGVSVRLTMGVSATGIPLSPATLVMPYYTRFLPPELVDAQMRLLGLGHSLATAPLNKYTARLPRVIKTDVFTRAQQIARAGQRVFITNPAANRDAVPHLALDLLGNTERVDQLAITPELAEWDELRRIEDAGRAAAAAMARELEKDFSTPRAFVDNFAAATSHRAPFMLAYVHGPPVGGSPRPYALSIAGVTSETLLDVHAEAGLGWTRTLPYGELTRFNLGGDAGELALIGRWKEDLRVVVLPQNSAFTLHLLYPSESDGAMLRADIDITGATVGSRIVVELARGARTLNVQYATAVATITDVSQTPLAVSAAAQDLYLDSTGHVVTLLLNRPVTLPAGVALRDHIALTISVPKADYTVTRRNSAGAELQIPGAVVQQDGRILSLSFDKTLSRNANYEIAIDSIVDLLTAASYSKTGIVPRIDNDRPGAILTGRVLRADNTPVPGVLVQLLMKDLPVTAPDGTSTPRDVMQHDVAGADGRFLYEFVPRDLDSGIFGLYDLETESPEGLRSSLSGAVRLPGEVHTANLVFLGRGRARGQVRYDDGTPIPNVTVSVGSTLHVGLFTDLTDADGRYDIDGLPVAPLTFSVVDPEGRTTFAANHLRTPGEVLTQDLVVVRKESPGLGTVRLIVKRSDTGAPVAGAAVGVSSQGYPLQEGETDANGRYEFRDVPAGLVTMLASAWSISRHSAAIELDLHGDQTVEQTLVIQIADVAAKYGALEGTITRDDPASPSDASKDAIVPGAIVTVGNRPAVIAGADGAYVVLDLPVASAGTSQGNVPVTVFDPVTGRKGWFTLPTLVEGTNHFSMRLTSSQPDGVATMRVRLYGSHGEPVSNYRVFIPGYPPTRFSETANGVYELANVSVPRANTIFAVPIDANGSYGEQVGQGQVRVDFHGQIGVTDVRLSGSGTIVVRLEVEGACGTCPPTQAIGPVAVTYSVWDDASQGMYAKTVEFQPAPSTGLVTLTKIPARQNVTIATVRNPAGYASTGAYLAYDGDVRNVTLRMRTIGDVTGRVFAHDGVTPVSGATVRILIGSATYSPVLTQPDGSFTFFAIPAATSFEIVAELNQDGLYRIGRVGGRTPTGGGPVADLLIAMREQSTVEGKVVDTNGVIVPLARYWLRELEWPFRSIGTPRDPLFADINGRFIVANVFTGAFRITAVHPSNQEIRGDYQGSLAREGDASQRSVQVAIGGIGVGAISITVIDPLRGFVPVENAEVTLLLNNGRFDFTSTNEYGVAFFDQVPAAGTYRALAYSKALGRAGAGAGFGVAAGQTTSMSVHLEFRGLVTGTLTDPESEPANLPVKGMPVTLTGPLSTRDSTDENGAFEFDGVPEGAFNLFGYQIGTDRYAFGPAGLFISKLVPEQRNIHLELERTGTLTVKVYLPNDSGGAGELAPLADVTACQCVERFNDYSYLRGAQGNPVIFPKMLRRRGYDLTVVELGGEARTVKTSGSFGANEYAKEQVVVLPSSGSVEVLVVDAAGAPVADAQVRINDRTMYTPASGLVAINGMPFGWITAQARKDNVAASAGGDLRSRTQPLRLTLNLGSSVGASGSVEAEAGGGAPSVRTRVVLTVTSGLLPAPMRLETLTGADGAYTFTGIPVGGTTLTFLFYGPDDTTIGATRVVGVPDGATGTVTVPPVRLDATPPRVLTIDPPSNSTNVSPSTHITVTFSEPIAAGFLTTQWFQLVATDNSAAVNVALEASVRPDGTYVIKLTPPAPPAGQTFPLKSNVLYRLSIPQGLKDTTGNPMPTPVGSSFTTVNYTEPDIVRVDPSVDAPLFEGATFRVKFNKPIEAQTGFAVFERLDRHHGAAVEEIPITRYADPADPSTMVVAPTGVAIAESSFYRLRIAEVHDTQTPANVQREQRAFDYFSFDTKKPLVTIVSPAETLVSGVLYSVTANVTDDWGAEASDVAYVDWLDASGVALGRRSSKPFAYSFTAPATATPTSLTLKASATDLSNNSSATHATKTWEVIPNDAPRDVVVTNTPSSIYPGAAVETRVRFSDEGVAVSVVLELRGTNVDGSELHQFIGSQNATRPSTSVEFAELIFRWNAPLALRDGTASIVATATDSVSKSGSGSGAMTVLADTIAPVFVALAPKAETRYRYGVTNAYTIELQVRDDQTAVERAIFTVNGATVLDATTGSYDATTRVTTFRATVPVPPKNADTRIPIVVTASDVRGNVQTETREVIYERVDDASVPSAAWLTPLDGAALPSNQAGWLTTLRVRATDDQKVTSVRFESTALAAPITLTDPKSGTSDVFEAKAALTMPADGSSFAIRAIVADGDPAHDVELVITVDPVVAAPVVNADINISSITADQYANKSLLVRGARVYITVPLTLKDLMLVDGAVLSVSEETKLDLTITDRLFVDGDSRIDVSGKGWLGGLARREDNSFTNPSRSGRTVGGANGATNASASHAGIGGAYLGTTNATYGSIVEPQDFGAGGAAQPDGSPIGGNGGGALRIAGGPGLARFVLAGPVFANGVSGAWAAGAGGSIDLRARALVTSPTTRIAALGADDDVLADIDMGGGGGRIALRITERLDALPSQLSARGGRNGASVEGPRYVDGGAGTIYVVGPDGTDALVVSAYDERYPSSTHRTMGTPIGAVDADSIAVGPRALARFDVTPAVTPISDATATVVAPGDVPSIALRSTTPAANGSVSQNTRIDALFDAASAVGIREVRAVLDVQPADAVTYPQFSPSLSSAAISANVPSSASAGAASLKLLVRDRAGRTAETAPVPFTVVTNAAPAIDTFELTPPTEIYAGHAIAVAASASDDIAVQTLTLASSAGTVSATAAIKPTPTTMTRTFSVALPPTATPGSNVTLSLSAIDDFPGRIATTATKSIAILHDTLPPSLTVVRPAANEQVNEGSGATFAVEVNASDAEVAVKRATVTFEGVESQLVLTNGLWRATLNVPNVDGTEPVAKTLTVKAFDYEDNVSSSDVAIAIKPLLDPNAPALAWVCTSPGAMAPSGVPVPLRVSAIPSSGANGVQSVTIAIGNGAPVAAMSAGTNLYQSTFTIPSGTADGTTFDVRVTARSVAGNESTLLGTLTAVTGLTINTASTIAASDSAFENQSLIVTSGGTLTIVGPHRLRNLVVLDGGQVVQKHVDPYAADELQVERLFVACNGSINVSALGILRNAGYPGFTAPDDASGGSHVGRGGSWVRTSAGAFGSIFEPKEPGSGGNHPGASVPVTQAVGGGMVRVRASGSVAIDGAIYAGGTWSPYGGGGGGSIWISTSGSLTGGGSLDATGSSTTYGAGGGGAIALRYAVTSGTLRPASNGGTSTQSRPGGAGTIAWNDDVVIDNKGTATTSATELPSFGRAIVTNTASSVVTLDRRFVSPSLVGHRVRAASGGTYRIAAITNNVATIDGSTAVLTQDAVAYDGWLLYSPQGVGIDRRKLVAARRSGSTWQYDTDTSFSAFTPAADDVIFATFSKDAQRITAVARLACAATCGAIEGVAVAELIAGEIMPNAIMYTSPAGPNTLIGSRDSAEIFLRGDGQRRALVLTRGAASTLTLQPLAGTSTMPQAGEVLRGVHQFNNLTLVSARVVTEDLVEIAGTLTKDASSTLSTGNVDVPVIDPAKVTIARGRDGAVVVGAAGAGADSDSPLEIVATNANGTPLPRITLEDDNMVVSGTTGGLSVHHVESYRTGEGAGSLQSITASGYLAFSASAATNVQVGLAPAAATRAYNEPGHNSFRMKTSGTYEIWANAAFTGKSGSYDAATSFRIEKTPASLRWFVDNIEVHAVTSNVPASLLLHISFEQSATGEVTSIEYVTTGLPRDSYHAKIAADGSFRVPIAGAPGDAVLLRARDRHPYSFESSSVAAGVIPNDVGVASLTFDAPEVTGGRTATATVTLSAPASIEGALVRLTSNNSVASLSETILVAPGAISATVAIATTAVQSPVDVTIAATHGSIGPTAVLRVVRDSIAPVVTVSAPLSGAMVGEGPANKITVTATASDADSGVKRIFATFDGQTYELTKGTTTWSVQIPMPYIEGSTDVTKDLVVTAVDNSDNSGSATVSIVVRPVVDGSVAAVSWSCSGAGAMVPVNYDAPLRVRAVPPNATNVVQKVEIVVTDPNGLSTTVPATPLGGDEFQYVLRVPDGADGTLFTLSARAVTAGGGVATVASSFTVLKGAVEIRANTTIGTTNTSYDNKAVVIWDGVTVTIDGAHTFQRLALLNGARIQHSNGSRFEATADALYVACGASIDASSRGYALNETYPGAALPGSYSSGSHIGSGGVNSLPRATTYGSVVRPAEAGGGGRFEGRGGGVIRIQAGALTLDGAIRADGAGNTNTSSAGGSVWLTVTTLAGSGSITANGGTGNTSGGGGAIAIDSTNAGGMVVSNLQAYGGAGSRPGSAGSVHVKSTGATFGNLTIDNTGRGQGTTELPSLGIGTAQAGSSGASLVTDRATDVPAYFEGHWIDVAGKGVWRIASINGKSVTLAPNAAESIAVAPGDAWRGVYRFDTLRIRNSIVTSGDRVEFTTLDKDAGSTLFVNAGAPVLDAAKIAVVSTIAANEVVGAAGAVSDPDGPLTLTVTNTRSAQTFTATAAANGSFRVSISGYAGDLFTIRATDGHAIPLSSATIPVSGTIVELSEIHSLSIAPLTVAAGAPVYGTLRLTSPARAGGVAVSLASSSANATVPATLIVPGRTSSVQFAIATTAPTIATDVTITATTGTNSKSATFTLTPSAAVSLIDVALSAASVEGGTSVNGTVLLGAAAPPGGAIVMLASNSPHAIVPETVVVPEGTTQASFTLTTRQVSATTALQVTATWGASRTADLQLTPCASMGAVTLPSTTTLATVWVDDAAPAGATASGEATFDATRVAFGSTALHFAPPTSTPVRTYSFTGAAALATTPNDRLALWALVNPCNPPRQIVVTWSDGTNAYRVAWGESRIDPTASQIYAGAVPTGGEWTRLDVLTRALGFTANRNLTGLTIRVDGGEVWFDGIGAAACATEKASAPTYLATEQVWFDDAFPAALECCPPNWDTTQVASGTSADLVIGNGSSFYQHWFTGATPPMTLAMDDVITAYVFLDPCNPPREIMLQFNYGNWDRRVYWGENLLDWDTVNSVQRRAMGPLPEAGKWVRLEVPVSSMKLAGASLNGAAFTVNDGRAWFDRVGKVSRVNLASGKPAQQSSTYAGDLVNHGPQRVVDGDSSSYNHTLSEAAPYWQVDLGAVQPIEQIDVWRSAHCCPERSANAYVFVSDEPFVSTNVNTTLNQAGVSAYYHLVSLDLPTAFTINRTGRYVRVQLAGTNYLHLGEVQVWAPVSEGTGVNLASGAKATQSSTYFSSINGNYIAALAVNGASMGENLSHTNSELEARWEVDLGAVQAISTIDVNNAFGGTAWQRMANVYLFVSDTPFAGTSVASSLAQTGVSAFYRGPALSTRLYQVHRTGRYIRLQLTGTDYLHPMEVKVWSPTRTISALAKPVFDFTTVRAGGSAIDDH